MLETGSVSHFKMTLAIVRQFAAVTFCLLFGLAILNLKDQGGSLVFPAFLMAVGIFIGGVGLVSPKTVRPFLAILMALVQPLGLFFSKLVLGSFFWGLVTPLAFLLRLTGRDPLQLRKPNKVNSFWVDSSGKKEVEDYFHQS